MSVGRSSRAGLGACVLVLVAFVVGCSGGGGGGSVVAVSGGGGPSPNPVPAPSSISPNLAVVGQPGFSMALFGSNFVPTSQVFWNGSYRVTGYINPTTLTATIYASDLSASGTAEVTVVNPPPGGGTSQSLPFMTYPNSTPCSARMKRLRAALSRHSRRKIAQLGDDLSIVMVAQSANDIVSNESAGVLYASVPIPSGNGNSIVAVDPTTGNIAGTQFVGNGPDRLAISDDDRFLYSSLDQSSSVQRFTLPALSPDISIALPVTGAAHEVAVAPGSPHTSAVTVGNGDVGIFDDATLRPLIIPNIDGPYLSLQWGCNPTVLLADYTDATDFDFFIMVVNSSGGLLFKAQGGDFNHFSARIHYDGGTNLAYSDDGHIIDPSTGLFAGFFDASGVMIPDSSLNAAFFLGQTGSQYGTSNYTIESFDMTTFTPVNAVTIQNVSGTPIRLIRWGSDGLAFNTTGGQIVLVSGSFVGPSLQAQRARGAPPSPVRRTWR